MSSSAHLSTVWDHLLSAWTRATDLAARLATRLASHIARVLKPALVALLIGACQDQTIARLIARELEPVRTDIAYAINRVRALEDTVYDHSQVANTRDGEHLDTQNWLLQMSSRVSKETCANKHAVEMLQLELEAAKTEIQTLKRASSPSAKPEKTISSSAAKRTRPTTKTTTLVLDVNASVVALCRQTKPASAFQQPVRWRA